LTNTALYTKHHTENYVIYYPWFEEPFLTTYKAIRDYTVVKEDRCYIIEKMLRHTAFLNGHFAECGTYKGGTAYLIAKTARELEANKKLYLFDTFSGMPNLANQDTSGHIEGDVGNTSLSAVQSYLKDFDTIEYVQGIIPETFSQLDVNTFSFVHVDVDLYQTVKDCCDFFYNRLVTGGVLLFDDYGFRKYEFAAKKAVDEFFMNKSEVPIVLPTGQCLIIKH